MDTRTSISRRIKVLQRIGVSRSTLYLWIASGSFPAPISLGGRAVGWLDSEIDAWLADRVAERRVAVN
jgi:prophage regulatory protein